MKKIFVLAFFSLFRISECIGAESEIPDIFRLPDLSGFVFPLPDLEGRAQRQIERVIVENNVPVTLFLDAGELTEEILSKRAFLKSIRSLQISPPLVLFGESFVLVPDSTMLIIDTYFPGLICLDFVSLMCRSEEPLSGDEEMNILRLKTEMTAWEGVFAELAKSNVALRLQELRLPLDSTGFLRENFNKFTSLKKLTCDYCTLHNEGFIELAQSDLAARLEVLALNQCGVTDEVLTEENLRKFSNLKQLVINGVNINLLN